MAVQTEQLKLFDGQSSDAAANANMAFNEIDLRSRVENDGFGQGQVGTDRRTIRPRFIPSPVKAYTANRGRGRPGTQMFEAPQWDLAECGRILDTESYVRRAFRNKKNLFTKEGYEFVGAEPRRVRYIKKRLEQMEIATGIPFKILMAQTISSLIRTSNAFWIKVRKTKASGGRVRTTPDNKTLNPVAGYFLMAPETVRFKRDEYGKLLKYEQNVFGKEPREFPPENVVHFYFDKREGFAVGTPSLVSVKDDIRALRRIEENVELLVHQHLFPLFHYKVGTDAAPAKVYSDGRDEVQEVRLGIAQMPSDGCWVTPERHTIEAVTAKGSVVAVDKVIAHFKQRIFTGLGNSSVDMGEGGTASRSAAQTMSQNLIQDTKADQKELATFIESFVITELMLESTFPDGSLFNDENKVHLRFNEIDFEARQAKENHLTDLFLKNVVTHDEMRTGMGREPFDGDGWPTATSKSKMFTKGDGDFARTNYGLFDRDKVILQSLDEPGTEASKSEAKSRTATNKSKPAGGGSVSNKNQPANQHGTRPAAKVNKDSEEIQELRTQIIDLKSLFVALRDRETESDGILIAKDSFSSPSVVPSLDVIFSVTPPLQTAYDSLAEDIGRQIRHKGVKINEIELLVNTAFAHARDQLLLLAKRAYRIGLRDTGVYPWQVRSDVADGKIQRHIERYVTKLAKEVTRQLKRHTLKIGAFKAEDAAFADLIFKALRHRADMIDNSEIMKAYNYGKASGHRVGGFEEMRSFRHNGDPCDTCDNHVLKYENTDAIIYEELPPLHPHCTCTMESVGVEG